MWAILFSTVIAPSSQVLTQSLQPIHPAAQTSLTAFPNAFELHATLCSALYGTSSIRDFGQTDTHLPQATHFSLSTRAMPFTMWIASKSQTFTQLPNPVQPYSQAFGPPPGTLMADTQSSLPKYLYLEEAFSQVPAHLTKATI